MAKRKIKASRTLDVTKEDIVATQVELDDFLKRGGEVKVLKPQEDKVIPMGSKTDSTESSRTSPDNF